MTHTHCLTTVSPLFPYLPPSNQCPLIKDQLTSPWLWVSRQQQIGLPDGSPLPPTMLSQVPHSFVVIKHIS